MTALAAPDCELAVLSAVMLDNRSIESIQNEGVEPRHFGCAELSRLWHHMREMADEGKPVDVLTLGARLNGRLGEVGGARTLGEVADFECTTANVLRHARLVKVGYWQRQEQRLHARGAEGENVRAELLRVYAELERLDYSPAPRLSVASYEEVMEDTTPESVVEGLLYDGTATLYCGLPKRGKTYSAAQLSLCIASGEPFLDLEATQGRVLYCTWELSLGPLRDRIQMIARDVGLPDPGPYMRSGALSFYGHRRAAEAGGIDLTLPEGWAQLDSLRRQVHADVVVIDTLSKVAGLEMKDTAGWQALAVEVNRYTRVSGATLLVVDHASRLRIEESASVVAMGSQSKGSNFPVIAKLVEKPADEPSETRWKLEVDSWYGDAHPLWFGRPVVSHNGESVVGAGCVPAEAPSTETTTTKVAACERWLESFLDQKGREARGTNPECGGWVPKSEAIERAQAEGFGQRMVERAAARISVQSQAAGNERAPAKWRLG